ncbi:tyrosine-type recombinase/integrase [Bradyrhizobium sp. CSA207]|uniref:tyrosine-type recombinase/integrase n=1 Tax=Bradyrhizobium sp. CSA207 TaxID=2698826 RepID=UPI0023AF7F76|nr:tyrosine-type recombinase/integrase [Bradyrhizobium sp. CSA207]MDE5444406.1 tyrosine-type recombinase/integrase [Bradyrhizobium sp. CSA207]
MQAPDRNAHTQDRTGQSEPVNVYLHTGSRFWQMLFEVNGKPYRKSSRTTSKREAIAKAKRWKAEVLAERAERRPAAWSDARPPTALPDMPFGEAAQIYWDQQGQFTRNAEALDGYLARIVQMVGPDKMCSTIARDDERRIRAALRRGERPEGIGKLGRPLKVTGAYRPRSINGYTDLIGTVLNWVEIIPPYRWGRRRRRDETDREIVRPRYRWLTFEEQWRLDKVMEPDLKDAVLFAIDVGIREDELSKLTWSAIDWALCTVTFPLKAKGTDEKMHTVDLTEEAMAILYARRALHKREGVRSDRIFLLRARRNHWHQGELRKKGELIEFSPQLLYRRFIEACGAAGVQDMLFHDLRRTAGRRIYDEEGSDIEAARALLGHVDIKTTQDYLGVTGTAINPHLRRRSARAKLALAELEAAARRTDAAPGSRAHVLHDVLTRPPTPRLRRVR